MYLIDTNIFLEILLEQEKSRECESLLSKIPDGKILFYVGSFTIHSIEVIMTRNKKLNELTEFLMDIIKSKIDRLETSITEDLSVLKVMKEIKLDFDDAMQCYLCTKFNLNIVSYDKHFDKTKIKRAEPSEILFL